MPILHWLDRDKHTTAAECVPYRLLEPDDGQSAGDPETLNMLIQGDNLEALKALLPYYAGRVKCIFIDPPYNAGRASESEPGNTRRFSGGNSVVVPMCSHADQLVGAK